MIFLSYNTWHPGDRMFWFSNLFMEKLCQLCTSGWYPSKMLKGLQTSIIIFEHPRDLESTHEFSKHHHKTFQHKFYFIFSNRFYGFTPNDVYILIKVKCNTHFPGENKVTSSMVLIVKEIYSSDYKIEYFNSFAICCELRISVLLREQNFAQKLSRSCWAYCFNDVI